MYLHNNIRILRNRKGLTQEQLSEAIGKSKETINGYEKGRVIPPFDIILKLSEIFSVSLDDFVFKDLSTESLSINEPKQDYSLNRFIDLLERRVDELEQALKDKDPDLAKKLGIK